MQNLGYLLITIGFLGGSLAAVQTDANAVDMRWFIPAFLLGVTGVVLARLGSHRAARHEGLLSSGIENVGKSLDRIVKTIVQLESEKDTLDAYEFHHRIDALFPEDLNTFVESRESIGHVYGLNAYADVMNEFAAGERYLNRVWSASIDGYIDEIREYLGRSKEQFLAAQHCVRSLQQSSS